MSSAVRNLAWKEWHEQRWKLVLGSVILGGLTGIGLQARIVSDLEVISLAGFVGAFLWPIFVAMGLVAYERGEGSLHSLLALPVRPALVVALKVLSGTVACLVPLASSALIACFVAGGREVPIAEMLVFYSACPAVALCLMLWTLCFSVRQPSEGRAGLVGVGLMLIFFLSSPGAEHKFWGWFNPLFAFRFESAFRRLLRWAVVSWEVRGLGVFLLVQLAIALVLFLLTVVRLPRQARSRI
ncbi:MAG: ABC transporter permease subunit [Planctomycetota bacterium]|jgi:hypothetical protein